MAARRTWSRVEWTKSRTTRFLAGLDAAVAQSLSYRHLGVALRSPSAYLPIVRVVPALGQEYAGRLILSKNCDSYSMEYYAGEALFVRYYVGNPLGAD